MSIKIEHQSYSYSLHSSEFTLTLECNTLLEGGLFDTIESEVKVLVKVPSMPMDISQYRGYVIFSCKKEHTVCKGIVVSFTTFDGGYDFIVLTVKLAPK